MIIPKRTHNSVESDITEAELRAYLDTGKRYPEASGLRKRTAMRLLILAARAVRILDRRAEVEVKYSTWTIT